MGVAIDVKNDEIWVAQLWRSHRGRFIRVLLTATWLPQRIIRNAPRGTPTGGFGNPYAVAYDSKRDQLWYRIE